MHTIKKKAKQSNTWLLLSTIAKVKVKDNAGMLAGTNFLGHCPMWSLTEEYGKNPSVPGDLYWGLGVEYFHLGGIY